MILAFHVWLVLLSTWEQKFQITKEKLAVYTWLAGNQFIKRPEPRPSPLNISWFTEPILRG